MSDFPWFFLKIDGVEILDATAKNVSQQTSFVEHGEIIPIEDGSTYATHVRRQKRRQYTISGSGSRKPAVDHLEPGQEVMVDLPGHMDLTGDIAEADLPDVPAPGSLIYFGQAGGSTTTLATPVRLQHGDPGVRVTGYRPRRMLRFVSCDFTETPNAQASPSTWNITFQDSFSQAYAEDQEAA